MAKSVSRAKWSRELSLQDWCSPFVSEKDQTSQGDVLTRT